MAQAPSPKYLLSPLQKKSARLNRAVTTNAGTMNVVTTSAEKAAVAVVVVNAAMPRQPKAEHRARAHATMVAEPKAALKDAITKHAQRAASDPSVASDPSAASAWSDLSVANAWSAQSAPTATALSATTAVAKHAANRKTKCVWRHRLN